MAEGAAFLDEAAEFLVPGTEEGEQQSAFFLRSASPVLDEDGAVLAVLHFWWLVKSDIREPLLYAGILSALLGWRLWKSLSRRRTAAAR